MVKISVDIHFVTWLDAPINNAPMRVMRMRKARLFFDKRTRKNLFYLRVESGEGRVEFVDLDDAKTEPRARSMAAERGFEVVGFVRTVGD